jgi:hypothetical protein
MVMIMMDTKLARRSLKSEELWWLQLFSFFCLYFENAKTSFVQLLPYFNYGSVIINYCGTFLIWLSVNVMSASQHDWSMTVTRFQNEYTSSF